MYCIPCTPLIALSNMVNVDLTNTSAFDPGNSIKILTLGGAICGNWATGVVLIANMPMKTITTDKAIASTGLFINLLNIVLNFKVQRYSACKRFNSDNSFSKDTNEYLMRSLFLTLPKPSARILSFAFNPEATTYKCGISWETLICLALNLLLASIT